MDESLLEQAIMLALRRSPGSRPHELAEVVGLPRTNLGRQLKNRLRKPLGRLLAAGVVDEEHGRYQLTEKGRKTLSERISTRSPVEAAAVSLPRRSSRGC
jgi:DNA-binding MarR family transcriptional regulator